MTYDPKKKRPSRDSVDAIVDEILDEEASSDLRAEKTKISPAPDQKESTLDNVLPLYAEEKDAPLIMQPQVWVATGIAAVLLLMIARRRKKR